MNKHEIINQIHGPANHRSYSEDRGTIDGNQYTLGMEGVGWFEYTFNGTRHRVTVDTIEEWRAVKRNPYRLGGVSFRSEKECLKFSGSSHDFVKAVRVDK